MYDIRAKCITKNKWDNVCIVKNLSYEYDEEATLVDEWPSPGPSDRNNSSPCSY